VSIEPSGSINIRIAGGHLFSDFDSLREIQKKEFQPENEYMEPIYLSGFKNDEHRIQVEKGKKLTFYVRGRWRLFSDQDFVESGYDDKSCLNRGYPLGCLIFEQGGKRTIITDGLVHNCESDGTALVSSNVGNWILSREGFISVWIKKA
jgi:hypothetical protein